MNSDLVARVRDFIEMEGRSCSMDRALIHPEYVYRMWGGKVEFFKVCCANYNNANYLMFW